MASSLKHKPQIIALSGSLRASSSTVAVLRAVARYLVDTVVFTIDDTTGNLPHFDDSKAHPESVLYFRKRLAMADGIMICTPEYAFGVPGTLKNALDWAVSTGEFVNKPVALITAATGGENAHRSLLITLTALSANLPESNSLLISFIRAKMNEVGEVVDLPTLAALRKAADSLVDTIEQTR